MISDSPVVHSHGNPTVIVRDRAFAGRLMLERVGDRQTIWVGYPLPDPIDAVRVDVWHGDFCGDLSGGAVLPVGDYEAVILHENGERAVVDQISVFEQALFDLDLVSFDASHLEDTRQWQCDGQWSVGSNGLASEKGAAHLHAYGAMHGTLRGQFSFVESGGNKDAAWGLLTRFYNSSSHLRLECRGTASDFNVRLLVTRQADVPPWRVLAEVRHLGPVKNPTQIEWVLNSFIHRIYVDGDLVLEARNNYMGGVTVVGLFAEPDTVNWQRVSMASTQPVPCHAVKYDQYHAVMRPGNIMSLMLTESAAPDQNLCWESGIQLGHIGGSELKFTQGSKLHLEEKGPLATVMTWRGPMPSFSDQTHDVRGEACGKANFYPDRIVIADDVLTWVRRSVGPDFDLLGKIMPGPALIALAGSRTFEPWEIKLTDEVLRVPLETHHDYPVAAAFPFQLGTETWWLQAVITLRYPTGPDIPTSMFAWQDPLGLTASHDFRACPTKPGIEYAHAIVITWCQSDDPGLVTQDILNLRDDWTTPMKVKADHGQLVGYDDSREFPREAVDFNECFDQSTGRYVVIAEDNRVVIQLEPGEIRRRAIGLTIRQWSGGENIQCVLDGQTLRMPDQVLVQRARRDELWLWVYMPIENPVELVVQGA